MPLYDPNRVLDAVSDHTALMVLIGGVAIVCNYVFFIEAVRLGFRHRTYPFALWATAFWWPHDGSYLLDFHKWFYEYGHWFPKLFWVALIGTFVMECLYVYQTIRFGREELAPRFSQPVFALLVLAAVAAGCINWIIIHDAFRDDLYLVIFMVTILWCGPAGTALLSRRQSRRGQSVLEWSAFTTMASSYFLASLLFFDGGFFHSWKWIALSLAAISWGLFNVYQVHRAPAYRPDHPEKQTPAEAAAPPLEPAPAGRP